MDRVSAPSTGICTYDQNFEDVLLWRALHDVTSGFYIDVGAQDPVFDSVSKGFYELGWRGIHVEPTVQYSRLLREDRPDEIVIQAAVMEQSGLVKFFPIPDTGMSTARADIAQNAASAGWRVEETTVAAITLDEIFASLDKDREIHWLKIDVEGHETQTLSGWRNAQHRPWIIVVEAISPTDHAETFMDWEPILLEKGYSFVYFDTINRYYVSSSHGHLATQFQVGPCLWDGFQVPAISRLNRRLTEHNQAELDRLKDQASTVAEALQASADQMTLALNDAGLRSEALSTELDEVRRALRLAEGAVQRVELELDWTRAELTNAVQTIRENGAALNHAQFQLDRALAEVEESSGRARLIDASWAETRSELARVRQALSQADLERTAQTADLLDLAAQLEAANRTREKAETDRRALKREIATLSGQVSDEREELESARAEFVNELARAEAAVEKARRAHQQVQHDLTMALEDRGRLAGDLEKLGQTHAEVVSALDQARAEFASELARSEAAAEQARLAYEQVQQDLALSLEERARLAEDLERLGDTHAEVVSALENSSHDLEKSSRDKEDLEADLNFVHGVLNETRRTLDDARSELASAQQNVAQLERAQRDAQEAATEQRALRLAQIAALERSTSLLGRMAFLFRGPAMLAGPEADVPAGGARQATLQHLLILKDEAFVESAYLTLLGRAPDPAGLKGYLAALRSGQRSRRRIVVDIATSAEGQRRAIVLDGLDALIREEALRPTSLTSLRQRAATAWRSAVSAPDFSRYPKLNSLLALQDAVFVTAAYRMVLGREPDAPGFASHLAAIRAGADPLAVLAAMHNSVEGRLFAPDLPGLNEAVQRLEKLKSPVTGPVLRLLAKRAERKVAKVKLGLLERKLSLYAADLEATSHLEPLNWRILDESGTFGAEIGRALKESGHCVVSESGVADRTLVVDMPTLPEGPLASGSILAGQDWGETGYPVRWIDRYNAELHSVATVSNHTRKILVNQGLGIPVAAIGVGLEDWRALVQSPGFATDGRAFSFLHVSACEPEDGVDLLAASFARVFRDADDVSLIIKPFGPVPLSLQAQIAEGRATDPHFPHILVMETPLTEGELKALYQQCDVFVAPVRARGFGLPIARALTCGVPVVATAWGGHLDYCDAQSGWLVDFEFMRAKTSNHLPASIWVEPIDTKLDAALRAAHAAPLGERRTRAQNGEQRLLREFSWAATAAKLAKLGRSQKVVLASTPVAMLTTWKVKCGIASHISNMLSDVPAEDVLIFAARQEPTFGADGPNVIRAWDPGKGANGLAGILPELHDRSISTLIIQFNYGFFNHFELAEFIEAAIDAGIVVFIDFHSTVDPLEQDNFRIADMLPALHKCHRLLAHGPADLNRLKAMGLQENVMLFPLGVVRNPHEPMPTGVLNRPPLLASFGFAFGNKGLVELVQAIAHLKDRGTPVRLLMLNAEFPVPESAEIIAMVRATIKRLGLEDVVDLRTEYLDDETCLALLSDADLIVNPYQKTGESASAAVRYGLTTARPVAVTPLSIFDDLGDAAFRLPGIGPEQIADGLIDALYHIKHNTPTAQVIRQAAKVWLEVHDVSRQGTQLLNMVKTIAAARTVYVH